VILSWIGRIGLDIAFVGAVAGAINQLRCARGQRRSFAMPAALVSLAGIVVAVGAMQTALISHNFSLAYVAENNATFTPLLYSITGMWSALEGSLLLWSLILGLLVVAVVFYYRRQRTDMVVAYATMVLFIVAGFFLLLMVGPADPFLLNPAHVLQGAGPNALLQDNPLVAIHPPLLYSGFVGFTVPFAFAMAMLLSGRVHEQWPIEQRRWTVLAWGSLSVGIVLGSWWSYQVLGWGGFWGWDPVENAALLPWLTATAYIHSVVVQDRRGLFRVWNLSLAVGTFSLTVLGTFFTRSGVLQSVHAFSSSTLGPVLIGFFGLSLISGLGLIAWRGDELRTAVGVDSPFSREGLFVMNNILFVGFALVVLLGTAFPLLYQAINGVQVTVGTPYFAAVAAPGSIALLALMGIAPLVSWRRFDAPTLWRRARVTAWVCVASVVLLELAGIRHYAVLAVVFLAVAAAGAALRTLTNNVTAARRRGDVWSVLRSPSTAGMVVHLGVVILAVGIVVSTSYTSRTEVTLSPHQRTVVDGHTISFSGFAQRTTALEKQTLVRVTVDGTPLQPAITTFNGRSQAVGTPAISSNVLRDVYITFDAVGQGGSTSGAQVQTNVPVGAVVLGVTVEPLLSWLWIGGLIIGLGSALTLGRRRSSDEATT
jgi:cytochrome c-type biogenesis protein CcmF